MKWYSVKEHHPVLSICCVLLAVHVPDTGAIYLTLGEWDNGWKYWEDKESVEGYHQEVLYFCYPDPIPKAYEHLIENQYKEKV